MNNDYIDNTLVISLEDSNINDLNKFCSIFDVEPDDVINKMISWCYHSKYFWDSFKNMKKPATC